LGILRACLGLFRERRQVAVLGAKQAETALFSLLFPAVDQAVVADRFPAKVGRRMPATTNELRSAPRFNATMCAAILILAV
jgi:hypothetical protein